MRSRHVLSCDCPVCSERSAEFSIFLAFVFGCLFFFGVVHIVETFVSLWR